MIQKDIFETETMAELCTRQGRTGEAIDIFRHLLEVAPAAPERARWQQRLDELERSWQPRQGGDVTPAEIAIPAAPGVAVAAADDVVTVAWALPPDTQTPGLEVLVLVRTPAGIETTKRSLVVATSGRTAFSVPGLHSAVAAAGCSEAGRFVPLARSPRG